MLRTDVLGSQHSGVGGGLVTVGLDLHATGDTGDGLTARQIGDVDEGIVERGEDAGNAEDELALADLGAQLLRLSAPKIPSSSFMILRTWMFSCAARATFCLGGMLSGVSGSDLSWDCRRCRRARADFAGRWEFRVGAGVRFSGT